MSEALHDRYDSLQWTEKEVEEAVARCLNPDEHPELRPDLARLPKERAAYIQSRHSIVDKIVWRKFGKKMRERGLFQRWADEIIIPNTIPVENPARYEAEIVWFDKHAPDLVPELKAHRQWQHERNLEWERIWLEQQQQSNTDDKTADDKTRDMGN